MLGRCVIVPSQRVAAPTSPDSENRVSDIRSCDLNAQLPDSPPRCGWEAGIPSCANRYLMTELARNTWGFQGYITSDCWAVQNVGGGCPEAWPGQCNSSTAALGNRPAAAGHNYTHSRAATMNATLGAGMDKDCSGFLDNSTVIDSVTKHGVAEAVVDDALRHSLLVTFRLGLADPANRNPFNANPTNKSIINCPAHQAIAKDAADQSLVGGWAAPRHRRPAYGWPAPTDLWPARGGACARVWHAVPPSRRG